MPQNHDIGHQKRRKNAEALELLKARRDARRGPQRRDPMHSPEKA